MANSPTLKNIEPRLSILEKGQEALQKDISKLSHIVEEQGKNITLQTAAFRQEMQMQNEEFRKDIKELFQTHSEDNKTDWQTIWTLAGVIILAIGAILAPIYMQFSNVEKIMNMHREIYTDHEKFIHSSIYDIAEVKTEIKNLKNEKD